MRVKRPAMRWHAREKCRARYCMVLLSRWQETGASRATATATATGEGQQGGVQRDGDWRQLSLLVFPWLLRAAATLSRRALLSRANEGRRGRRCCEAKVGGRGRDGRRWASDRLHQRDQQRQIPDGKRDVFPPPPPKERLAFVESARQRFALAGPGPTCTQHVLALAQASLSNPLCPSKATGR
jgi:hypothetical protein